MKRIAVLALSAGLGLFAVGCGRGPENREMKHDVQRVVQDIQVQGDHAAHDAAHAVQKLEVDVHPTPIQVRDDVHYGPEVVQVRGQVDAPRLPPPAVLRQDAKRDAVRAVGDTAEEAAEKLFNVK